MRRTIKLNDFLLLIKKRSSNAFSFYQKMIMNLVLNTHWNFIIGRVSLRLRIRSIFRKYKTHRKHRTIKNKHLLMLMFSDYAEVVWKCEPKNYVVVIILSMWYATTLYTRCTVVLIFIFEICFCCCYFRMMMCLYVIALSYSM